MVWQPIYATDGELRSQVRIGDVADDAQIALALATASRAIDARCARQFGRVAVPEAREYTPRWSRSRSGWRVPIDDLTTSTGLEIGRAHVELQSHVNLVCRLLLEKKKKTNRAVRLQKSTHQHMHN